MHSWVEALLNLLFPGRAGCRFCGGRSSKAICRHCLNKLADWAAKPRCSLCGTPVSKNAAVCLNCSHTRPPFELARAAGPYEGGLREAIRCFKYRGIKSLAPVLAEPMLQVTCRHHEFLKAQAVLPVPISPGRVKQRGFNQAELLAQEIARGLNLPLLPRTLVKSVDTPPQTGLTGEQRRKNLQGAFKVIAPGEIAGKTLLLVDDVFTSGSTASVLTYLLLEQGAADVLVLTAANAGKAAARKK